jgi:MFS family permease
MSVPPASPALLLALDEAPMDGRRYRLWLAASGGVLLDGFSIFALGVAMPLVTRIFAIGPVMVGLIGAALVMGAVVGAALGGRAADRFGRKPAFVADMAIAVAGAILTALSDGPLGLLVGQFVLGIGIGIDFPVSSSYVSELMPRAARSRMVVATIALQSVGMLIAAAISVALLTGVTAAGDWRLIVGSAALAALVFLAARLFVPESPRWLIEHGRGGEAAVLIGRLAPGVPPPAAAAAMLPAETPAATPAAHAGMAVLFSPAYRDRTLLASLPWFLMDIATYGVGLFTPVILGAIHLSSTAAGSLAGDLVDAEGSAAIDLFLLIGFIVGVFAVPRFGRIHMQLAGFAGMGLGMLILFAATLGGAAPSIPLVFAGFILFNLAMNAGPNATTFSLAAELFPTGLRATASGFAAASAKVGATLGIFVLPAVKDWWGVSGVLLLMALVSLAGLAATFLLSRAIRELPEGRRLEEGAAG